MNKYVQAPAASRESSALLLYTNSSGGRNVPANLLEFSRAFKHSVRISASKLRHCKYGYIKGKLLSGHSGFDFPTLSKRGIRIVAAALTEQVNPGKSADSLPTSFAVNFPLRRTEKVDGKIRAKVSSGSKDGKLHLTLECDLPGSWVLHWGVTYSDDPVSEWDQPPADMQPPGSVIVKDYAAQTPLVQEESPEGKRLSYVQISIDNSNSIAAINFLLKDEDTGTWYKDGGKDFRVILAEAIPNSFYDLSNGAGLKVWPGILDWMSGMFLKPEESPPQALENGSETEDVNPGNQMGDDVCKEYRLSKENVLENFLRVSVQKNTEEELNLVSFDTDLPGDVVLHWGVCKDDAKRWEILQGEYPSDTIVFRRRALQTTLQRKDNGTGSWGVLCIDDRHKGLLFVLKLKGDNTWLNNNGDDFYIPLTMESSLAPQSNSGYAFPYVDSHSPDWTLKEHMELETKKEELNRRGLLSVSSAEAPNSLMNEAKETLDVTQRLNEEGKMENAKLDEGQQELVSELKTQSFPEKQIGSIEYKDAASILLNKEIKSLVERISAESSASVGSVETQEKFLQEIERLAAKAYNSFKDSTAVFIEESEPAVQAWKPKGKPCSGTGSGYEVVLQGFNWESHRSGEWYRKLSKKADEIASWGFTIVWLPPPTDSVSPEGYMPRDLYNLNSRYGSVDELKDIVRRFHEVGVKVLGDAVLNHRCAQYQNHNGVWNIFGGRLNWDDRAIVSDDAHFQGRGNRSSGDFFHAAPNIDHSQEFVRRDLNDWLQWLRSEIGYDGWRLDFVRGFWGGYVKDYIQGSEPYFAVGEYWDSLSYTYGQMDHDQDAHRQRIIDWINATDGNAGAFDVTTKGILHTVLEKCEYWRLSDKKGKPPGVVGWWPSRAVTFIENHDTGSTQGHWRFPAGKEMQGYAYILTHPGTPAVFHDHLFSKNCNAISSLIAVRKRAGIHCRSVIQIVKAERDVYAAKIDKRVLVKIGPGHYQPPNSSKWIKATEGPDYKVWEAL